MTSLYCLNPFVYPRAAVILISLTVSLYGSTVEETAYLILYSPACSNTYAFRRLYVHSDCRSYVCTCLLCGNVLNSIRLTCRNSSVLCSRDNSPAAVYNLDFNCLVCRAAVFVLYLILYLVGAL